MRTIPNGVAELSRGDEMQVTKKTVGRLHKMAYEIEKIALRVQQGGNHPDARSLLTACDYVRNAADNLPEPPEGQQR